MKTFEQIALEYAKEKGYTTTDDGMITELDEIFIYEGFEGMKEVALRYTRLACEEQRTICVKNAKAECFSCDFSATIIGDTILNAPSPELK